MLAAGHEVSVLDDDPLSHDRLDSDQETSWEDAGGRFTIGKAIERDALVEAGIEQADVFLASTNGDNTNLMACQIAKHAFNVPIVVSQQKDAGRGEVFATLGVLTVSPTSIGADAIRQAIGA